MPGAVNEVVAETFFLDVIAHGAIDFPSGNHAAGRNGVLNGFHAGITPVADNSKYFAHTVGRRFADESRPGNVVINSPGGVLLCPDIEQDEVALANGSGVGGAGLVMRVPAIAVNRNDGRIVGDEVLA